MLMKILSFNQRLVFHLNFSRTLKWALSTDMTPETGFQTNAASKVHVITIMKNLKRSFVANWGRAVHWSEANKNVIDLLGNIESRGGLNKRNHWTNRQSPKKGGWVVQKYVGKIFGIIITEICQKNMSLFWTRLLLRGRAVSRDTSTLKVGLDAKLH